MFDFNANETKIINKKRKYKSIIKTQLSIQLILINKKAFEIYISEGFFLWAKLSLFLLGFQCHFIII